MIIECLKLIFINVCIYGINFILILLKVILQLEVLNDDIIKIIWFLWVWDQLVLKFSLIYLFVYFDKFSLISLWFYNE